MLHGCVRALRKKNEKEIKGKERKKEERKEKVRKKKKERKKENKSDPIDQKILLMV